MEIRAGVNHLLIKNFVLQNACLRFSHENNASRKSDSPIDAQPSVPAKKSNLYATSATMSNGQSSSYYANDYFQVPPQPPPFLSSSTSNWLLSSATASGSAKDCHTSPEERKHIGDNEWNNIYVVR